MTHRYPGNVDDILFGNVLGHVAPGSFFVLFGFWWLFNVLLDSVTSNRADVLLKSSTVYRSRTWYALERYTNCCKRCKIPVEPCLKFAAGFVGILAELSGGHWTLFNSKRDFEMESLNNFSHATMFAFFALIGVVELLELSRNRQLPAKSSHAVSALFCFVEGLLFYYHLDNGRDQLDVHAHVMLYYVAFASSFILLLEAYFDNVAMLGLARCYLFIIQGTWFYQITFMLYGPHPWSAKSPADLMFLPIAFSWHLFIVFIIVLIGVSFRKQLRNRCFKIVHNSHDVVPMEYLLEGESNDEQDEDEFQEGMPM